MSAFIEHNIIVNGYSPDVVAHLIKENGFETTLSTKTIYNYIDNGVFLNLTNRNLLIKSRKPKREHKFVDRTHKHLNNRSIDLRPDISDRQEFGHWEMDTVIGKSIDKPCLLVLTERKTRFELVYNIFSKSQLSVAVFLNSAFRRFPFPNVFKSITMDNGSEFLNQSIIEFGADSKPRTVAYYCHPYSSWERGSNENQNKLIRRFIPKGHSMDKYSEKDIKHIENWINTYPRKILGYRTPADCFESELSKLNNL